MSQEARETGRKLQAVLEEQAECYRNILELSRRQAECIKDNDAAELMQILAAKQKIMNSLQDIHEQVTPLVSVWEKCREELSEEEREPVEAAHAEVKNILAEVITAEEAGQEELSNRKSQQSSKLVNMQKGKQMLRAYGGKKSSTEFGRFTDKKN